MAEYNFWDDRTHEDNDENWCLISNDYCYDHTKCSECDIQKEFDRYVNEEVKKQMKVELLNYTPHPEATIAAAARLCYSSADITLFAA